LQLSGGGNGRISKGIEALIVRRQAVLAGLPLQQ
jgi:hypothetical protein